MIILYRYGYNFVKPLKTLRLKAEENSGLKWMPRTPAMTACLTDHVWTLEDVFSMVAIKTTTRNRVMTEI